MKADVHARRSGRASRVFAWVLLVAGGNFFVPSVCCFADTADGGAVSKVETIDQARIDYAMERLAERLRIRAAHAPAGSPATRPFFEAESGPSGPYPRPVVQSIKGRMLRERDEQLRTKRVALRRGQVAASDVRTLSKERAELEKLSADRLRSMLIELETKNTERHLRYRESFGELASAGRTVVLILIKGGMIDAASVLPEDPLTLDLDESRGVRRIYYQFDLPNRGANSDIASPGASRRYNGFVEFAFSRESSLWVPTWADVNGDPTPLFNTEAFGPLRPFQIAFDGTAFVVTQQVSRPVALLSLLARKTDGPFFGSAGLR